VASQLVSLPLSQRLRALSQMETFAQEKYIKCREYKVTTDFVTEGESLLPPECCRRRGSATGAAPTRPATDSERGCR